MSGTGNSGFKLKTKGSKGFIGKIEEQAHEWS